jgi:perosamine synthetase
VRFLRFGPERCAFPKPRIAHLPDRPELLRHRDDGWPATTASESKCFRHFSRGRYALGEACRLAGIGHRGALLAPAYHCVTMLDPAMALAADVELYPLHADFSPDLEKLDELLECCEKPVKALLATHFFGFPQDFSALQAWCDERHIVLIEDCSHVLFTERFRAAGTGTYGRFAIASPYKFFPCDDGGLLYSATPSLLDGTKTASASPFDELRGLKRMLESLRRPGPRPSDIGLLDGQLRALSTDRQIAGVEQIVDRSQPSAQYSGTTAARSSLRSSRLLVSHLPIADSIERRRRNFRRWAQALLHQPNCRAPIPDLPPDCVPYMFPLLIERPNPHFYWLKQLGVPLWRWDEMAVSACPIARDYRLRLIHLPCHQALTDTDMDWMIAAVQKTLSYAAGGAP